MRKTRLWMAPGLLALWMSACGVFYISSSGTMILIVSLTPGNPTIAVGGVQQFIVNVTYADGLITEPSPVSATWTTSDSSVAAVNSQGQATGVSAGKAVITSTYKGVSGSTVLTVAARSEVPLQVDGAAGTLNIRFLKSGRSFSYKADAENNTVDVYEAGGPQMGNRLQSVVSVLPGRGPAWLAVSPSGRFLYVANHGSGNISAFLVDPASGRLADVPGSPFDAGSQAWSVAVDSGGKALAATGRKNSTPVEFPIDPRSGILKPVN